MNKKTIKTVLFIIAISIYNAPIQGVEKSKKMVTSNISLAIKTIPKKIIDNIDSKQLQNILSIAFSSATLYSFFFNKQKSFLMNTTMYALLCCSMYIAYLNTKQSLKLINHIKKADRLEKFIQLNKLIHKEYFYAYDRAIKYIDQTDDFNNDNSIEKNLVN